MRPEFRIPSKPSAFWIPALVVACSSSTWATSMPAGRDGVSRPNIVLLLVDDLGCHDLGCYGHPIHETPDIDQLARDGMLFSHAYAAGPVCSPTRASLLTGQYPARLRLTDWLPGASRPHGRLRTPHQRRQLPLEETTLAECLADLGYTCGSIGKWHLGRDAFFPEHQGFHLNIAGSGAGAPHSYFAPYGNLSIAPQSPDEYLPDRLTAEAAQFIRRNRERSFFLYMSYSRLLPFSDRHLWPIPKGFRTVGGFETPWFW